ncbi:phosphatidylinositol kinase [Rhodococcus sp. WMMA185]|uniref:SCO1664 family protein n=1 Tax=Rhodococcus sp. WMMA185 TaxID=679318 RepID=UPI0008785366|nr:SCO1664 family protein [Rhodococcus sp. WMMA185]AOW94643.1 phosphatidylinositol kinase [Rhodococcus sp. WMMA185]
MSAEEADPPESGEESDALLVGELTLVGRITDASNATLVCDAVLGESIVRCVYKPIRGERALWDFPDGTLAGREYASYLVSEQLGWSVIPRTVLREGPFGRGMVQRWVDTADRHGNGAAGLDLVDICSPETVPPGWFEILQASDMDGNPIVLIHADDPRLQRMAVLDVLINNADRKGGHALEGLDGAVYGVDHGICLHTENKLRTVLWGWAGTRVPEALVADIVGLISSLEGNFAAVLGEHITADEVVALYERAVDLVAAPVMPRPSGRRPIPWPAF